MSLAITVNDTTVFGDKRIVLASVDFDSSYPTGGEALTPANFSLDSIDLIVPTHKLGYLVEYDKANSLLKAFYFDYDAGADGAAIQVANATNLSGLTGVQLLVIGT